MGHWGNTTYVNHGNVGEVADAVAALCRAEGMEERPAPPQRDRLTVEPMQYEPALRNDLWGLAIFPGAPSWTVIQTAPLELLAERAAGAAQLRLADLCRRLSASAFQIHVHDGTGTILVEVSPEGVVLISGVSLQGESGDPLEWHGERLSEERIEARFTLHPFQALFAEARSGEEKAKAIAGRFGGVNSAFCDNIVSVDTLIRHKPFAAPGGVARYFRWPGTTRQRFSACASWTDYLSLIK